MNSRPIHLAPFFVLLLLLASLAPPTAGASSKGEVFRSPEAGFEMTLAPGWKPETPPGDAGVALLASKEEASPGDRATINVLVENIDTPFASTAEYGKKGNVLLALYGFEILKEEMVKIGDNEFYRTILVHSRAGVRQVQYALLDGSRGYVITCTTSLRSFHLFRKDIDDMVKSFRIIKNN